jgi:hypothetical protein
MPAMPDPDSPCEPHNSEGVGVPQRAAPEYAERSLRPSLRH